MVHIGKVNFRGDPNLGFYAIPTDDFCIVGKGLMSKNVKKIEEILKVKVIKTTITGSELIGLFSTANKNGIVLPRISKDEEVKFFKKLGLNVYVAEVKQTALGNLILVNDKGCIISPELKKIKKNLEGCFGVQVEVGTIAGLSIVGSAGCVTNQGLLVHRDCTEQEMKLLEDVLEVEGDVGTVSFGSPFVGASIVANSNGFLVSEQTSGPELQRIDEALGFVVVR